MSNKNNLRLPAACYLLLAVSQTACTTATELTAVEVLNHTQCQLLDAGVTQIDHDQIADIRGGLIQTNPPQSEIEATLDLFAVSKGQQPTPGYHLALVGASERERTATIEITWSQPPANALLAQVITHPCIVVGLTPGTYTRVRAVQDNGRTVGELAL